MSKILGYVVSAVGLLIAIASFQTSKIAFLSAIPALYLMIGGIAIIIVGVALTMTKSGTDAKQVDEEVPIYEGKKIVGYRKRSK